MADPFAEALLAEIGAGIDDETDLGRSDADGGAEPFVFRIVRGADRAVTADHGNPDRGSGAEEGDFRFCLHCKPWRFARILQTVAPFRNALGLKIKNLALVDDLTWELGSRPHRGDRPDRRRASR